MKKLPHRRKYGYFDIPQHKRSNINLYTRIHREQHFLTDWNRSEFYIAVLCLFYLFITSTKHIFVKKITDFFSNQTIPLSPSSVPSSILGGNSDQIRGGKLALTCRVAELLLKEKIALAGALVG